MLSELDIPIGEQGHARVSDFSLALIAHDKCSAGVKSGKGRTVRWFALEDLLTILASE